MFTARELEKVGLFAAGFAFGTAGVKILSSKDAKKVYTNCTAAVLRAKDSVMKTVNTVQEMQEIFLRMPRQSMKKELPRKQKNLKMSKKILKKQKNPRNRKYYEVYNTT